MKKLVFEVLSVCFISAFMLFSSLTLFAQAYVLETNSTNSGETVGVPDVVSTNAGVAANLPATAQTNTGSVANLPATAQTNTGATAGLPATAQTNPGAEANNPNVTPATPNPQPSGSGGSVSFTATPCSGVIYGEWGAPANGYQYRDVLSQIPAGCSLTVSQQAARSRNYPLVNSQILGVKDYPDGSLLRGPDKKIYFITESRKLHIKNLKELANYRGIKINNVSYEVLSQYAEVLGVKVYADGSLLRGPDKKIYLIIAGGKQHIKTLKELRQNHLGKKINDVSFEVLSGYPNVK